MGDFGTLEVMLGEYVESKPREVGRSLYLELAVEPPDMSERDRQSEPHSRIGRGLYFGSPWFRLDVVDLADNRRLLIEKQANNQDSYRSTKPFSFVLETHEAFVAQLPELLTSIGVRRGEFSMVQSLILERLAAVSASPEE